MNEQFSESLNIREYPSIQDRIKQVVEYFAQYNGVAVAFSGGVDSSTLAALALKAQGDTAIAITADCQSLPRDELESAKRTAESLGIKHIIVPYNELEEPGFADNPVDRCYHCKKGLYRNLLQLAQKSGLEIVADGTNASEMTGQRPGHRAALEYGIKTPFADFGITKNEIRKMAKCLGLSIWDKPQQACLSSRFPYGHLITEEGLARVEAAEQFLAHLGIVQLRVRDYGRSARIEVQPDDLSYIIKNREVVVKRLRDLGYTYITLDLEGFRSGSMNEVKKI
jgi:uncharacterized protein